MMVIPRLFSVAGVGICIRCSPGQSDFRGSLLGPGRRCPSWSVFRNDWASGEMLTQVQQAWVAHG